MGGTSSRQQAVSRDRVSGGASGQVQSGSGGAATDPIATGSGSTGEETRHPNWEDERIPVVFTWTHGGQNVSLAASFNGWKEPIPMVRSGNEFAVVKELPRGVHQYRFIVDDTPRVAPDQPKDPQGNMNNVIDISQYQRFQITPQSEIDASMKFNQTIPDPNGYSLDAPSIPQVLHKSHAQALPPRPHITGGQVLTVPHHSMCDHLYVQERPNDKVSTSVAVTHRYNQKYSTTVYVTRTPLVSTDGPSNVNYMKKAMREAVSTDEAAAAA